MSGAGTWRDRLTRPRILATRVAPADRTAGLVTMVGADGVALHAWQVPAGVTRPAATPPPNAMFSCWLSHDGRHAYVLADEGGNELGHLSAMDLHYGGTVDLTPTLPPYTVRGLGVSRSGAGLVLDAVDASGYHIYHLADPSAADPQPRLLARYANEAWNCLLSADGALATVDTTEHNPGVRAFAVQALRVADGEVLGSFSDGPRSSVEGCLFSPSVGEPTVVVTTDRSGVRRPVLWRVTDDSHRPLATDHLPGDVIAVDWSDEGRYLLLCHAWRASQQLLRYDLHTDGCELLDLPPGTYHDDVRRSSHFGPDGTVLAAGETLGRPLTVYRHAPGGRTEVALATSNVPAAAHASSVDIASSDGTLAQGWLATPEGDAPFPTILAVHGGPHWVQGDAFDPVAQMWLEHGYAYLGLNFRGSTTFGKVYKEAVWGDVGHWELEDMVATRHWLVGHGVADPDRVLVAGASYGGFLTLYALSVRPQLWAGGIAEVALADWTMAYQDANPALRAAQAAWLGGTPEQVPDRFRDRSPLTHLADLSAPVLIRQGRHDTRTPRRQMEVYEQEAKRLGKPVTVVWQDGGHAPGSDPLSFQLRALDFAAACVASRGEPARPQ